MGRVRPPEAGDGNISLRRANDIFVGRKKDLAVLAEWFAAGERVVTVTGGAGIGKTRLAFAVSRQLRSRFADGVWVAELAPLSDECDPQAPANAIATAIMARRSREVR